MAYPKPTKVKNLLSINWLLFSGSLLLLLSLIMLNNAVERLNHFSYQWCCWLAMPILWITACKCWFYKGWVFATELLYGAWYGGIALALHQPVWRPWLGWVAILVYALVGLLRILLYGRVEYRCFKRRAQPVLSPVSPVWRRILAKPYDQGLVKIWHVTVFCGATNLILALLLLLSSSNAQLFLLTASIDLSCAALALVRVGLLY